MAIRVGFRSLEMAREMARSAKGDIRFADGVPSPFLVLLSQHTRGRSSSILSYSPSFQKKVHFPLLCVCAAAAFPSRTVVTAPIALQIVKMTTETAYDAKAYDQKMTEL